MAVTKTHPIKSTLKAAIDYICNPEKTDGKLLVSSYGCAAETADIEFAWTRRHAIDKGTNLGRHLIQAFPPGEVTPEQAHEIGMELAKEMILLCGAGGVPGRGEIPMIQIATLVQIDPKPVNLHRYMDESIPAIQKNLQKSRMCTALQEPWESCVLR